MNGVFVGDPPRLALAACLLTFMCASARAATGQVALTFDDLPALSLLGDQAYVNDLNTALLRGLRRHRLPATGFVNEGKVDAISRPQQIANLKKWVDAGMGLGNHTFSHETPETLGGVAYIEDIVRGEPIIRKLLGRRRKDLVWFRHPYLETGTPQAVKAQIDDWLQTHVYRVAPVTLDADDWQFAEPYDEALYRRDQGRRQRIKGQYLAYTERAIAWYQKASDALFDRQIPFVMLLHATRLNADSIDELASIFRRRNLRGVSLEHALRDPAYRTQDPYVGRDGVDWMERWSHVLNKELPWTAGWTRRLRSSPRTITSAPTGAERKGGAGLKARRVGRQPATRRLCAV